ncbi:MAG TPA: serine hydrolase domain-containing protein [Rugosimonospora sp.]|nr:serine hydrolase domain-containing protein [Rugosimonospora sp.]
MTGPVRPTDPGVERGYRRQAQQAQAELRIPALAVALHRADRPLWTYEIGALPETLFRIGSVTKTFTAVLVMQCRDEGLLGLDDPIGRHLGVPAHGDLTVRRLLSHTSGLQREPFGDVWDTLRAPGEARLLADLVRAEAVLAPGRRYHYSNLGYALLGRVVAQVRGGSWAEVLADRILRPLGLGSVTPTPEAERMATGYLVDAYSDHARPEPSTDFGAVGPAAQLWGTAADLARWAAFLNDPAVLDPSGAVLAPATLDEMRWPVTPTDEQLWAVGFGLGLIAIPQGERRVHVGHDGAMPGFLAAVYGRRGAGTPPALGAAVLAASGTAAAIGDLPHELMRAAVADDPPEIQPWRIGEPAPEEYRSVLGRWWGEGFEYVFSWRDGALRARGADDPAGRPPAVFGPTGEADVLRTVSGRETGELLRLTRDATGTVTRMHWATYRFTRDQQTFDGVPASHP